MSSKKVRQRGKNEKTRPEISIKSNWAEECAPVGHPKAPKTCLLNHDNKGRALPEDCFREDHLFSKDECKRLVARAEKEGGFGVTLYNKAYRGNLRLITMDPGLAARVWERLKPLLPSKLVTKRNSKGDVVEAWEATGLNECWRLAKYHPGDRFGRHFDACFERSRTERSMYTVNIYMNGSRPLAPDEPAIPDNVKEGYAPKLPESAHANGKKKKQTDCEFVGGSTRFFANGYEKEELAAIQPVPGKCLIFRQPPGACLVRGDHVLVLCGQTQPQE